MGMVLAIGMCDCCMRSGTHYICLEPFMEWVLGNPYGYVYEVGFGWIWIFL